MSGGRTLNVNIEVNHVHLIVGSQNRHRDRYSINCAALLITHKRNPMAVLFSCICSTVLSTNIGTVGKYEQRLLENGLYCLNFRFLLKKKNHKPKSSVSYTTTNHQAPAAPG